jgi:hypothetical protein
MVAPHALGRCGTSWGSAKRGISKSHHGSVGVLAQYPGEAILCWTPI